MPAVGDEAGQAGVVDRQRVSRRLEVNGVVLSRAEAQGAVLDQVDAPTIGPQSPACVGQDALQEVVGVRHRGQGEADLVQDLDGLALLADPTLEALDLDQVSQRALHALLDLVGADDVVAVQVAPRTDGDDATAQPGGHHHLGQVHDQDATRYVRRGGQIDGNEEGTDPLRGRLDHRSVGTGCGHHGDLDPRAVRAGRPRSSSHANEAQADSSVDSIPLAITA